MTRTATAESKAARSRPAKSNFAEYSDMIARIGEQRRRESEAELALMKRNLPSEIRKLDALDNKELVEKLMLAYAWCNADPRKTAVMQKLAEAAKRKVIARMGK